MPVKLLIFDLDGTLVDSSLDISKAINYAFGPYGIPEVGVAETISLIGEGLTRLIGKVIERKAPDLDLSTLVARFLEHYSTHLSDSTRPYPGVEKVLRALHGIQEGDCLQQDRGLEHQGARGSRPHEVLRLCHGWRYASGEEALPIPIFDLLRRFNTRPDEALLVGDSIYDIDAGRAAGVRTVAALYGYGGPGFWKGADYRIESIEGLIGILD